MQKILQLPEYGKHLVFVGSTGSGKSYLAQKMLEHYERYFAIDTQDSLDIEGKTINNPKNLRWILKFYPKIRYVPRLEYREKEVWDYIFEVLNDSSTRKKPNPRIVYIDEIYHLGYGANFPNWLPKAITTARQKKISYWIATQRPRNIPLPILTEASFIYVFYLSRDDDIKYLASFARKNPKQLYEALQGQENDYSFIEINVRTGEWQKYPKLKS